ASNTASVPSTIPSRVAAIQGMAECLTWRCTSRTSRPVLRSYQERLSSSVALPSCTIRLLERSRRRIAGNEPLEAAFFWPLSRADQICWKQQRQRGWKLYSFHAPEVECTGQGQRALRVRREGFHRHHQCPSTGWPIRTARQDDARQPLRPYLARHPRRHSAAHRARDRARLCRQGYRGHDATNPRRVFISGQRRGVFGRIKRGLRRRSAIEAVI